MPAEQSCPCILGNKVMHYEWDHVVKVSFPLAYHMPIPTLPPGINTWVFTITAHTHKIYTRVKQCQTAKRTIISLDPPDGNKESAYSPLSALDHNLSRVLVTSRHIRNGHDARSEVSKGKEQKAPVCCPVPTLRDNSKA